ncbi:MAG: CHAT domain-containing protein, partial [bacterium]
MLISKPKILCLFSAPLVTPKGKPLESLDVEAERTAIVRELSACNRQIELRIGFATIDELARGISDGFNILHFSGHGNPEFLLFEDGKGGSQPVKGNFLKKLIGTGGPFELAIVSACHSELIANMLVEAGVRHVLAIKCEVPVLDKAAITFTGQFYQNIFRRESIQKSFEMAKLLVEGNPELMRINFQLEILAQQQDEQFVPEQDKFVLLPKDGASVHLDPLLSQEVQQGMLNIDAPKFSMTNIPVRPQSFTGRSIELYRIINQIFSDRL